MADFKAGDKVKVFAEVGDGQGDVMMAWVDGTIVGNYTVSPSIRLATGHRPGIVVNVPASSMKNKNVSIEDGWMDTVVTAA